MMLWLGASRADLSAARPVAPKLPAPFRAGAPWAGARGAASAPEPDDADPDEDPFEQPVMTSSPAPATRAAHENAMMRTGIPRPPGRPLASPVGDAPAGLAWRAA